MHTPSHQLINPFTRNALSGLGDFQIHAWGHSTSVNLQTDANNTNYMLPSPLNPMNQTGYVE
jgi:hypothetical protein